MTSAHDSRDISAPNRMRASFFGVFRFLSFTLAMLSIVMLIKHGLDMGSFVAPLQIILDYYERLVQALLGWTEPYLQSVLDLLQDLIGWDLQLDKNWKYVFVLMMLFFAALSRDFLGRTDEVVRPSRVVALSAWMLGVIISLGTSIWLGVSPISDASTDPASALSNALVWELYT